MTDYPEHDKMQAMRSELDAVSEFLELLYAGEIKYGGWRLYLAYDIVDGHGFAACEPDIADLLAQWSGIDQNKLEVEKRQMLDKIRSENGAS